MKRTLLALTACGALACAQYASAQWYYPGYCAQCQNGACRYQNGSYAAQTKDDDCMTALADALIKEVERVRGDKLTVDDSCKRRAALNAQAQAYYKKTGRYYKDKRELAASGGKGAADVVKAWQADEKSAVLLGSKKYTKIGASVRKGVDGKLYWSLDFAE